MICAHLSHLRCTWMSVIISSTKRIAFVRFHVDEMVDAEITISVLITIIFDIIHYIVQSEHLIFYDEIIFRDRKNSLLQTHKKNNNTNAIPWFRIYIWESQYRLSMDIKMIATANFIFSYIFLRVQHEIITYSYIYIVYLDPSVCLIYWRSGCISVRRKGHSALSLVRRRTYERICSNM